MPNPARVAARHVASMRREACIVAAGKFGDAYCLLKNRDRNYLPEVSLVHEVRDGVEVAYLYDESTGWAEGMNEHGVGIVNAALMVSRDESERDEVERTGKKLKDGERILKALGEKTVEAAAKSVRTYKGGLKGHTIVSDGKKTLYVEMPDGNDVDYDEVPEGELFVRTNHGVEFPDAGYVEGDMENSSKSRQADAEEVLSEVDAPEDVAPALLRAREDRWDPQEMVRDNRSDRRMRTTTQMVVEPAAKKLTLYILPGRVEWKGLDDRMPKGREPKITVEVVEYEDLSEDTDAEVKKKKVAAVQEVDSSASFPPFKVGDVITYGKFQNKPGQIVRMFLDERGVPMIEVAAVGHARRKNRVMGLYRVRHASMAARVATRWLVAADPLVKALREVHDYLVEARRRSDDDDYFQWMEANILPIVEAVRRLDAVWTEKPSRPAYSDPEHVRDVLEGGNWVLHMADGGYSRLVLHGPFQPGPVMHFEVNQASAKTRAKWEHLVEQGFGTPGGHIKMAAPAFGPRQDLTQGIKFRVKSSYEGILVRIYQGTTAVGWLLANWSLSAKECKGDVDKLRERHPELAKADVLYVWKAFIDEPYLEALQGKGIGRAMYQVAMAEGFKARGPFLFTNTECVLGSGTSAMAKRVWQSLARQYPSSGDVVAVLRPPVVGLRTAAGKYKEKKKVKTKDGEEATVYVYSEKQVQHRHREKAKRYEGLKKDIDSLRKQVEKDIGSDDPKTRLTALAVALIDATFERVGNEESADEGHYGVTGWLKKHVTFGKGKATIRYVGKSGVDHEKVVDDAKLVKALKDCCGDKKPGDPLLSFGKDDAEGPVKVSSRDVNEYLKPFDVTAKDLRGFHANNLMADQLRATRKKGPKFPEEKKEREKLLKDEFKEALEATAEAVGHEASTLRSQYLVPGLEEEFLQDGTVSDSFVKAAMARRVAHMYLGAG